MHHAHPDWSKTASEPFASNPPALASTPMQPFRLAAELSPLPILFAERESLKVAWANAAAVVCFQLPREELSQHCLVDFIPKRWLPRFEEVLGQLQSRELDQVSLTFCANDAVRLTQLHLALADEHLVAVGEFHPDTDATTSQPTDALTGLPDRRTFVRQIQVALESDRRDWGVLFVDLNDFKRVNDKYGHLVGDKVLVDFAQKLQASNRPHDLVVRYGGDEFLVLAHHVPSIVELHRIADRLTQDISGSTLHHGEQIQIGCTVGAAMADVSLDTAAAIIAAADRDMYHRKSDTKPADRS